MPYLLIYTCAITGPNPSQLSSIFRHNTRIKSGTTGMNEKKRPSWETIHKIRMSKWASDLPEFRWQKRWWKVTSKCALLALLFLFAQTWRHKLNLDCTVQFVKSEIAIVMNKGISTNLWILNIGRRKLLQESLQKNWRKAKQRMQRYVRWVYLEMWVILPLSQIFLLIPK